MRNSSLVEWHCAEDVPGLKHNTETADYFVMVGERSKGVEGRSKGLLERLEVRMPV